MLKHVSYMFLYLRVCPKSKVKPEINRLLLKHCKNSKHKPTGGGVLNTSCNSQNSLNIEACVCDVTAKKTTIIKTMDSGAGCKTTFVFHRNTPLAHCCSLRICNE